MVDAAGGDVAGVIATGVVAGVTKAAWGPSCDGRWLGEGVVAVQVERGRTV